MRKQQCLEIMNLLSSLRSLNTKRRDYEAIYKADEGVGMTSFQIDEYYNDNINEILDSVKDFFVRDIKESKVQNDLDKKDDEIRYFI